MGNIKAETEPFNENIEATKWFTRCQILKNALKISEFNNGVLKSENDELKHDLKELDAAFRNLRETCKVQEISIENLRANPDKYNQVYGKKVIKRLESKILRLESVLKSKQ